MGIILGDILLASQKLLNTLAWRKSNGIDQLLTDWKPPQDLRKQNPAKLVAIDFSTSGTPIWMLSIGKTNIKGERLFLLLNLIFTFCLFSELVRKFSAESFIKEALLTLENSMALMRGLSQLLPTKVRQHIILVDLRGLKMSQVRNYFVFD